MRIHERLRWSFSGRVATVIEHSYQGDMPTAIGLPVIVGLFEWAFLDVTARLVHEGNLASALVGAVLSIFVGYWLLVAFSASVTFLRTERSLLEPVSAVTEMIR